MVMSLVLLHYVVIIDYVVSKSISVRNINHIYISVLRSEQGCIKDLPTNAGFQVLNLLVSVIK